MRQSFAWIKARISYLLLAVAAIGLTCGAYAYPTRAVLPTLAFFAWALLLLPVVLDVPGVLGLFGVEKSDEPGDETNALEAALREGEVALQCGDIAAAEASFASALAAASSRVDVALRIADLYRRNGRFDEAVRVLEEAARIHPEASIVHFELARLLWLAGDRGRALEGLDAAVSIDPTLRTRLAVEPDSRGSSDDPILRSLRS